jgi:hypothetical protein
VSVSDLDAKDAPVAQTRHLASIAPGAQLTAKIQGYVSRATKPCDSAHIQTALSL